MKNKCSSLLLILLLISCSSNLELTKTSASGIPISISNPGEKTVDFQLILTQVNEYVRKYLPKGQYRRVVYKADCEDIPNGEGNLVVQFLQENQRFLGITPQVISAVVNVDIKSGTLSLSISDESAHYPNMDRYPEVRNEDFFRVLETTNQYLETKGIKDCNVEITQLNTSWHVLCDPKNDKERKCAFSIDPKSFEVIDYQPPQ